MAKLLYPKLSYQLQGCLFNVYNALGFGHKEAVYQNALEEEMKRQKIPYEKEKSLSINYDHKKVGHYRPDFVIHGKIILEVKALEFMPKKFETQLVYYLKGSGYKLGYLVNFGAPKLQIVRRIWTPIYKRRIAAKNSK